MHIKLIALIVVATAVIAAPAPEGVQADVIDNHAGPPETTGTRVSTVARDDHVQAPPESCDPHRRCTTGDAQCCQFPRQESTSGLPLGSLLNGGKLIDSGILGGLSDTDLPFGPRPSFSFVHGIPASP